MNEILTLIRRCRQIWFAVKDFLQNLIIKMKKNQDHIPNFKPLKLKVSIKHIELQESMSLEVYL